MTSHPQFPIIPFYYGKSRKDKKKSKKIEEIKNKSLVFHHFDLSSDITSTRYPPNFLLSRKITVKRRKALDDVSPQLSRKITVKDVKNLMTCHQFPIIPKNYGKRRKVLDDVSPQLSRFITVKAVKTKKNRRK